MDEMITKSFDVELVESKDGVKGAISALVVPFNNVDKQGDRVMPGSYKKSLEKWRRSGKKIPMIFAHGWKNPFNHIGYWNPDECEEVGETLDHAAGLLMKGMVDVGFGNPVADWVYRLMSTGRISQFSQGFLVPKGGEARNKTDYANEIMEVDLVEAGPTLAGVNADTVLMELKSVGMDQRESAEFDIQTKNVDLASAIRKIIVALENALTSYENNDSVDETVEAVPVTESEGLKASEPETLEPDIEDYRTKTVEWTPFNGNAALELAESAEDPMEALEAMCAGRTVLKTNEMLRSGFRLVHHSSPDSPPNVHAVGAALARIDQPQTKRMLLNYDDAKAHLLEHKNLIDEMQDQSMLETQDEVDVGAIQDYIAKASLELLETDDDLVEPDITPVIAGQYNAGTVGRMGAKIHELHRSVRGVIIQNSLNDQDAAVLEDIAARIKSVGRDFLDANLANNDTEMTDRAVVKSRLLRSDIESVRDEFVVGDDTRVRVHQILGDPILKVFNTFLHNIEMSRA